MCDSDPAPASASSPALSNPSSKSSKSTPSTAQPLLCNSNFPTSSSSASAFEIPPRIEMSDSNSFTSVDLPPTEEDSDHFQKSRKSIHYHTSSLSFPLYTRPGHEQLPHSMSSPALPCQTDQAEDSSQPGRYRQCTKSPSDGSDVRWYFCKAALEHNEAAASLPPTELVGKGEYFRFSKSDSDTLEAAFLQREEELMRAWWKEYAECQDGPSTTSSYDLHPAESIHSSESDTKDFGSTTNLDQTALEGEESVGVSVKGGLYEVDLLSRRCSPVYWRGDHRRVLRGHWFARKGGLDWLPLREDISEQLEIAYESQIWRRRRFQPSGLFAARVNLHGATEGLHALFTGEDDSWEGWLCVDSSGISFILGLRGSGVRIRRGFALPDSPQPTQDEVKQQKEEEMDDYASKVPVRHVVFMVHGIGQRLEKANLVDDVGAFRRTVAILAEQHLTQYQRDSHRVLFIPCQWRRGLKLGGESIVEDCTLEGVRALRTMLSATVHDVLYYMSPVYCQDIIDSVSHSLNRLFSKFVKRNPDYDGKVSIYGHSLGSVLSYDILCHQTADSFTSTAPIADIKLDTGEATEEVPSSGNGNDNAVKILADSNDNQPNDILDLNVESGNGRELESSLSETELEHNAQVDGLKRKDLSEELQVDEIMEVDALKAEVKMLQEKLSALMEEQSARDKASSLPLPDAMSHRSHATFEIPGNVDSDVPDGSDAGFKHGTTGEELGTITEEQPSSRMKKNSTDDNGDSHLDKKSGSKKHFTPSISYTKLDFEVDTFYAVGSPLGVFLSLRNIRIGVGMGQKYWQDDGIEEEMPAVRQMMNIFHPYDPVAYRIEPLICREFVKKRPSFVPYHKGGKRLHIGIQDFQEDLSARSKAIVDSLSSVGTRVASAFSSSTTERNEHVNNKTNEEKSYGALMMERLTGGPEGRLDYQLEDATFEHQYIAVLSSHTSYWQDLDTALFILKHLYKDIPREPPAHINENSEVPDVSNAEEEAAQITRLQEDSDPDEVSLTFSSKDKIATVLAEASMVKSDWMQ